jgi:hypothetical protein
MTLRNIVCYRCTTRRHKPEDLDLNIKTDLAKRKLGCGLDSSDSEYGPETR